MIIIAFSNKTSKLLPKLCCRHFKHVAPIVYENSDLVMYQFVKYNHVVKFNLQARDIKILERHGWKFIYMKQNCVNDFVKMPAWTCVQMTKNAVGIKSIQIQTPWKLYKTIKKI